MDAQNKKIKKRDHHTLWIRIFIIVGIGIMVWGVWFSQGARELQDIAAHRNYSRVRTQLEKAFTLFKTEQQPPLATEEIDIEDLRSRVFGDSIVK